MWPSQQQTLNPACCKSSAETTSHSAKGLFSFLFFTLADGIQLFSKRKRKRPENQSGCVNQSMKEAFEQWRESSSTPATVRTIPPHLPSLSQSAHLSPVPLNQPQLHTHCSASFFGVFFALRAALAELPHVWFRLRRLGSICDTNPL